MHYSKKIFARTLRKKQTHEEQKVWEVLRNRRFHNLKFRRQHVLEGFVVDFYCHRLRLVVEIDGKVHEKQKEYDGLRQAILEESGYIIIRVSNDEVNRNMDVLLNRLKQFV